MSANEIRAYRIVKAKYASAAFSGLGAKRYGGRWNSLGISVVYTAGSMALAVLEMLVHTESRELLRTYVTFEVSFDNKLVRAIETSSLPRNWRRFPPPAALAAIGDVWVAGGHSAILRVPSVLVPGESNFILNPAHPDFEKISIGPRQPLRIDERLVR
jgi:RES domain-containing protein